MANFPADPFPFLPRGGLLHNGGGQHRRLRNNITVSGVDIFQLGNLFQRDWLVASGPFWIGERLVRLPPANPIYGYSYRGEISSAMQITKGKGKGKEVMLPP
ncbi:hypothetical protein GUJ93_ZPchr0010g8517 [Zizania palustris]|uniref:Uncharacterized protein n=1 Tax=Zizania palustris TaxID=103762 RepID=A0A8J5WD07_ZIZPA|nr:hypothetical protein GUJ93_ZPchr0010g8517 [Zizania palustris]